MPLKANPAPFSPDLSARVFDRRSRFLLLPARSVFGMLALIAWAGCGSSTTEPRACLSDIDCAGTVELRVCTRGFCLLPSEVPDAGLNGLDTGALDANARDTNVAAFDGVTVDSSERDVASDAIALEDGSVDDAAPEIDAAMLIDARQCGSGDPCGGGDQDCDGRVDENPECAADHMLGTCTPTGCDATCAEGFGNCDGSMTNGCETPLAPGEVCAICSPGCSAPSRCVSIGGVARCETLVDIGMRSTSACARFASGRVACWGSNQGGNLGRASAPSSGLPRGVFMPTESGVATSGGLAVMDENGCATDPSNSNATVCWGADTTVLRGLPGPAPRTVDPFYRFSTIGSGLHHVCGLQSGNVTCWGLGETYQIGAWLGTGTRGPNVDQLFVDDYATCVAEGAAIRCVGYNYFGSLGAGNSTHPQASWQVMVGVDARNVRRIAMTEYHSCVLLRDGALHCFGVDDVGELGNGAGRVDVGTYGTPVAGTYVDVDASHSSTCAIRNDATRTVACWGDNRGTWLVPFESETLGSPTTVPGVSDAEQIVMGDRAACVRTRAGDIVCWGLNTYGQLGVDTGLVATLPVRTPLRGASLVSVAENATCGVGSEGATYCVGENASLRFGAGLGWVVASPASITANQPALALPAQVVLSSQAVNLLASNGTVHSIGQNRGRYGNGSNGDSLSFAPASSGPFSALAAGEDHVCGIRQTGAVECWGADNAYGQLGFGPATTQRLTPLGIGATADVISASPYGSCIVNAGLVRCWGINNHYQLGDGTTTSTHMPRSHAVPAQTSVALASTHGCSSSGIDLACWGSSARGALWILSSPTTIATPLPWPPSYGSIVKLRAAADRTCAVTSTNRLFCWGANDQGQIGDGTTIDRTEPAEVEGLPPVTDVAISAGHTCALAGGDVWCWGYDAYSRTLSSRSMTTRPHSVWPRPLP